MKTYATNVIGIINVDFTSVDSQRSALVSDIG
jgi:hypothetical protein